MSAPTVAKAKGGLATKIISIIIISIIVGGFFITMLYASKETIGTEKGSETINTIDNREIVNITYTFKTEINGKPLATTLSGASGWYYKKLTEDSWSAVQSMTPSFTLTIVARGVKTASFSAHLYFVIVGKDADENSAVDAGSSINNKEIDLSESDSASIQNPSLQTTTLSLSKTISSFDSYAQDLKSNINIPFIVRFRVKLAVSITFYYSGTQRTRVLNFDGTKFHLAYVSESVSIGGGETGGDGSSGSGSGGSDGDYEEPPDNGDDNLPSFPTESIAPILVGVFILGVSAFSLYILWKSENKIFTAKRKKSKHR